MTKSAQEILAEWADPETGGTMPREVREAALSVLEERQVLMENWRAEEVRCAKAEARCAELQKQLAEAVPQYGEVQSLREKLRRVRDWLKYSANSESGICREIDDVLEP